MNALRRLWRDQRGVVVAFVLAALLATFLGGRMVVRTIYWMDPAHHRQAPEGWMTPRYIARSWHLPVTEVETILGIVDGSALASKGPPTLERIAKALDVPLPDLIARLQTGLPKVAPPPESPP